MFHTHRYEIFKPMFHTRYETFKDAVAQLIVWKLLPRRVRYWATIRAAAEVSQSPKYSSTEVGRIPLMAALDTFS